MEHWAHRLFPKLQFEDFIDRVECLGNKKEVQVGVEIIMNIIHNAKLCKDIFSWG